MSALYSPGSAYAFVGPVATVVVSSTDARGREVIWPLVLDGAPIEQLAAALLVHAGGAADFVCLRRTQDRLMALVRGAFRVRLGDESEVDGAGATTWREWSGAPVWPVQILTGAEHAEESLPLSAGVVRVAELTVLEAIVDPSRSGRPIAQPDISPSPAVALEQEHGQATEREPEEPGPEQDLGLEEEVQVEADRGEAEAETGPVQAEGEPQASAGRPRGKYDHHYEASITPEELDAVMNGGRSTVAPPADEPATPGEQRASSDRPRAGAFIAAVPDFSTGLAQGPGAEVETPRQPVGVAMHRVQLPTGQMVELDRATIFGRNPSSPPGREHSSPHLIALHNPTRDISSSHLELRPEGEQLFAVDISSYGTDLQAPGAQRVKLPKGQPVALAAGASLHLNGSTALVYLGKA